VVSLVDLEQKIAHLTADKKVGDFSFEEGWIPLLWDLAEKVEQLRPECRRDFVVWQVKEKFGLLRIAAVASPEIEDLIELAVQASGRTCGVCGQPGELITKGWYRVRCRDHQSC
jgi:hypothetical protein